MAAPAVSVLIVSWNVRDYVRRCLASLAAGAGELSYEVILVDNASHDDTVAAVRTQFPAVQVIANRTNRGFTAANNQALAVARGEFLFLLNPDTEVQPGAIAELHRFLVAHPDVGIVGPRLLYPDGSLQSSRRRFPTLVTLFTESTVIQEYWPGLAVFRRYTLADRPADEPQLVDWVVGAAMLVRRQVYEQIGGLDEGFFMYAEEIDWCWRAQAAGWKVAYDPAAVVIHHEARSSEQVVAARLITFFRSRVRYARKYYGPRWAEVLRLWLLTTLAWQWLREAGKWLVGHKRPLRTARMAALRQALRSGLH